MPSSVPPALRTRPSRWSCDWRHSERVDDPTAGATPRHRRRQVGHDAQPGRGTQDHAGRGHRGAPAAGAQGRGGQHHRHHDRVVRLLPLRHRRRAGLPRGLLPRLVRLRRSARVVRDPVRRLPGAADRCRGLRSLGRPDRPQGHPDRDAAADGDLLDAHRRAAGGGHHRDPGTDPAGAAARAAGRRGGRRVGRLGAAVDGVGRPEAPGPDGQLAAAGRGRGPVPRHAGLHDHQPDRRRGGVQQRRLAHPVPAQHRAGGHRPVRPAADPGDADVRRGGRREPGGEGADRAGAGAPLARGRPLRAAADVGADAVLRGDDLRARVHGRRQRLLQELRARRHADRGGYRAGAGADVRSPVGHHRPQADLHDRPPP